MTDLEKCEALIEKRRYVCCDVGSIKVITIEGAQFLINIGGDGEGAYHVCSSWDEVPAFYHDTNIVLLNCFKIMLWDCYDRYDQPGEEVKTTYCRVLKSGRSIIFLNLYQD